MYDKQWSDVTARKLPLVNATVNILRKNNQRINGAVNTMWYKCASQEGQ